MEEFGIEPTPALLELERAILTQDRSLDLREEAATRAHAPSEADRALLVAALDEDRLDALLTIAKPLAALPGRELILVHMVEHADELERGASAVNARRASLGDKTRAAAFSTFEPAREVVRMAATYDVELVLVDLPTGLEAERLPDELTAILERSPADVGAFVGAAVEFRVGSDVYVPFAGGEHDWAALELAAWLSRGTDAPLRLVGTKSDRAHPRRDASRLLADASLAVQRAVGVETHPVLVEPTPESLAAALQAAAVVVVGMSPRWRREGLGLARGAHALCARPDPARASGSAARRPRPARQPDPLHLVDRFRR